MFKVPRDSTEDLPVVLVTWFGFEFEFGDLEIQQNFFNEKFRHKIEH